MLGAVGGNLGAAAPAAIGILVEAVAGRRGLVDAREVDADARGCAAGWAIAAAAARKAAAASMKRGMAVSGAVVAGWHRP